MDVFILKYLGLPIKARYTILPQCAFPLGDNATVSRAMQNNNYRLFQPRQSESGSGQ